MSHIDSFRHEIVGLFGGLPVYHPLEVIDGDFECDPSQLLIGGGSGEHPALVLESPVAAVACFLDAELAGEDGEHVARWRQVVDEYVDYNHDENLVFWEWSIATFGAFDRLCRSEALPNPYSDDMEMSMEEWLVLGFGEFVFFAMPELAKPLMDRLENPYAHFHHQSWNNVLLIPPNMPVYANGGNAFESRRSR